MRPTLKACFVIGILILIHCVSVSAQSKSWRQYTTNHGLPSNEVYDMLQDHNGYLWFVTDQGICRFNGYEFFRPADTSATRGTSAFVPTEDGEGRIWFARLGPSLWFVENDTVFEWKHNSLLNKFRGNYIDQLGIEKDGTTWISITGSGFFVVNSDGIDSLYRASENSNFTFSRVGDKIIFVTQLPVSISIQRNASNTTRDIIHLGRDNNILIDQLNFQDKHLSFVRGIWPLRNGGFIYDHGTSVYYIHENHIQWQVQTTVFSEKMVQTPNGSLLFASHHPSNPGLFQYPSLDYLQRGEGKNLLPGLFVTNILCDREGGWWASTENAGVYYCNNPEVAIYDTSTCLPTNDVVRLTTNGNQTIYAGLRPSDICAIHTGDATCNIIRNPDGMSREIWALAYDPIHARLWVSSPLHFMDTTGKWKKTEYFNPESPQHRFPIPAKKIVLNVSDSLVFISSNSGFFKIGQGNQMIEKLGQTDNTKTYDRTFTVAPEAQGNIWVITTHGLKLWKNNQYTDPPFNHPALEFQPRDLEILSDGTMVIGMRADGVVLKDGLDQFEHLTIAQGLTSNYVTKLAASINDEVFVCTNAGLNFIRKLNGTWKIQTLTTKQGLPSDLVNDATALNGEIWVATDKGLAHFKTIPDPYPMPNPVIEKITVNSHELIDTSEIDLRHDQNNITIRFHAVHYRSVGDIRYRYRLHGGDTNFIETKTRDVNFVQLAPGEYTFEVDAQNTDGTWSASTTKAFTIHPAWWQTWWFRSVLALGFVIGLWLFYRRRLFVARQKLEIQNKMRDLEAAALRAQMNPHFIFNCLVSIQQFIAENDADSASTYLAKFARLVRLALHSSVDGRHTLKEEVEMLENYLALEQLRFKNKFTYAIHLPSDLNVDEITLPPILIQPFVENAIVHGMKNKTVDGRIEITFSINEHSLVVTVTDNGPGIIDSHHLKMETGHKSVGMTLTQRRLDILSGQTHDNKLSHENIIGEDGEVIGSKVTVDIPLE